MAIARPSLLAPPAPPAAPALLGVALVAALLGALAGRARAECDAREALDSCLQHAPPPHPGPSLPATDEEVTATCRSFKARIRCFDEFVGGCGDDGAREALNALSAGARRALHRLCDDRPFRQEYLKHGPCYRDVTPGWETCRGQFLSTTPSPNCCARQRFLECVHAEGERRCEAEGARLLRQIAAMLTDATAYRAPCPLDACARARAAPALAPAPAIAIALALAVALAAARPLGRP
ncbi:hypothetical protein R5R35_003558 [Gryllus longicercus]|uniref:Secreted protein n=1 Tax=Gryllus longicercus TaxID=2509291 RepID=A0AAN9V7H6_9ORTH